MSLFKLILKPDLHAYMFDRKNSIILINSTFPLAAVSRKSMQSSACYPGSSEQGTFTEAHKTIPPSRPQILSHINRTFLRRMC